MPTKIRSVLFPGENKEKLSIQNAVEKLKFVSFEGNDGVFKEKVLDNATNNKYKNEISKIKNEKVKKSLEELSKYFYKKWKKKYLFF